MAVKKVVATAGYSSLLRLPVCHVNVPSPELKVPQVSERRKVDARFSSSLM
jgi:hypothetical protein